MSDFEHIAAPFRHVVSMADDERKAFLQEPRWIRYPAADNILRAMRSLMDTPLRPRMPNLLLVGDPNNGKTTIVRRFGDLQSKDQDSVDGEPIVPVVLVEAPPTPDVKSFYAAIINRFFSPYRATDPVLKLRNHAIHLLRECRTRLLVIDEFHSMLTGTAIKQREIMNVIKALCNESGIPIVGVGTRDAVRILHTDPQHASRFDVVELPAWKLDADFQRLLVAFERMLPLRHPSGLSRPELARDLFAISSGNLGDLHKLLVACATKAIDSGKEAIDSDMIKAHAWVRPTKGIRSIPI